MTTNHDIHQQSRDTSVVRLALRVGEAADALSISRSKMYGLIKVGKVRAVLVGDVMRIRVSDLEAYLAEN
jgi:excisionase family DNA binding protein